MIARSKSGKSCCYTFFRTPRAFAGDPFGIPGGHSHVFDRQRKLDGSLPRSKEVQRAQRYIRAFRAQRHHVEVHAVELYVGVEHRQTRSCEMYSG